MRPIRRALLLLLAGALLFLAACGNKDDVGSTAGAGAGETSVPPASEVDAVWRGLADGSPTYGQLGSIMLQLEQRCMTERGFPVHPTKDPDYSRWRPISREAPKLAPTVAEAEERGFSAGEQALFPVWESPNPLWTEQPASYRDDYLDAFKGGGGCRARTQVKVFGDTADGDEPMPVPDAFGAQRAWELYYGVPSVVKAVTTWRTCMKQKSQNVGYDTPQDVESAAGRLSGKDARALAKATAECVDAVGWREVHADAWSQAVNRLVEEEADAIGTWRENLNRVLDDAEHLLAK